MTEAQAQIQEGYNSEQQEGEDQYVEELVENMLLSSDENRDRCRLLLYYFMYYGTKENPTDDPNDMEVWRRYGEGMERRVGIVERSASRHIENMLNDESIPPKVKRMFVLLQHLIEANSQLLKMQITEARDQSYFVNNQPE
jgi:hypothetical protein